jgi:hypothetical protein
MDSQGGKSFNNPLHTADFERNRCIEEQAGTPLEEEVILAYGLPR